MAQFMKEVDPAALAYVLAVIGGLGWVFCHWLSLKDTRLAKLLKKKAGESK